MSTPDPFEILRGSDSHSAVPGLPVDDVRRLGDQRRRRRTAVRGGLVAAAVVAVVGGVAVAGSGSPAEDTTPQPAPSPTENADLPSPIASVEGVDLLAGVEDDGEADVIEAAPGTDILADLSPCDERIDFPGAVEDLAASWAIPMDNRARRVLLFDDRDGAIAASQQITAGYGACRTEPTGNGATESLYDVFDGSPSDLGPDVQQSAVLTTFTTEGEPQFGQEVLTLQRVGNAVLLGFEKNEGPGSTDMEGARTYVDQVAERLDPVALALCDLAGFDCSDSLGGSSPEPPPTSPSTDGEQQIPDDFPMLDGWPDDADAEPGADFGITGPSRDLDPLDVSACGVTADPGAYVDRLRANWANPEDYRSRELLVFASADEAVAAVEALIDVYAACPREPGLQGDPNDTVRQVIDTEVGGQSAALVTSYEFEGSADTVGLSIVHVVRLGSAVLIDTTSNEGSLRFLDQQLQAQTEGIASLVSAMCLFTEAGC